MKDWRCRSGMHASGKVCQRCGKTNKRWNIKKEKEKKTKNPPAHFWYQPKGWRPTDKRCFCGGTFWADGTGQSMTEYHSSLYCDKCASQEHHSCRAYNECPVCGSAFMHGQMEGSDKKFWQPERVDWDPDTQKWNLECETCGLAYSNQDPPEVFKEIIEKSLLMKRKVEAEERDRKYKASRSPV